MTKKFWTLMLVLSLLLTGCAASNMERTLDAAEEKVEEKLEAAEDRVEDALRAAPEAARQPETRAATQPPETTAATVPAQTEPVQTVPAAPAQPDTGSRISSQEAERIALDHAGLTAGDVSRLRSEFDWDDGVPQYDVEFRKGREEYEFEIHAESGKILSWDKDLDD